MDYYRIVFEHYRVDKATGEMKRYKRGRDRDGNKLTPWYPAERGGRTQCYLIPPDKTLDTCTMNDLMGLGVAYCSVKDAFCYRLGREISLGRARKRLQG